jgi:hypothetical protein
MTRYVVVALAVVAAGSLPSLALAGQSLPTAAGAVQLSDAELDQVAGGRALVSGHGPGIGVTLPSNANGAARVYHANFHALGRAATRN